MGLNSNRLLILQFVTLVLLLQIFLNAIMFNTHTHTKVYQAPTALDLVLDFPRSLYHHSDPVINSTEPELIYQIITLPSLTHLYQAYRAHVEISQCKTDKGKCLVYCLFLLLALLSLI